VETAIDVRWGTCRWLDYLEQAPRENEMKFLSLALALTSLGCVSAGSLINETTASTIQERTNLNAEGVVTSIDKGVSTSTIITFKSNAKEKLYAKGKGQIDMGYKTNADGSFDIHSSGAHAGEAYVPPESLKIFNTSLLGLISNYLTAGATYAP